MAVTAVTAAWPRREIHVVGLVGAAHLLSHLYMLALVPLYPLIQPEIGTTWTGIGAAITVFAVVTGVLQTPVGFLVDRIGGRFVLIGGLFIFALAIGLIGFVVESDFTIFNSGAQRYRIVPWGQNTSTSAASAIRHPPLPSVQQKTVDSRQSSVAIPIDNAGEDLRDLILR